MLRDKSAREVRRNVYVRSRDKEVLLREEGQINGPRGDTLFGKNIVTVIKAKIREGRGWAGKAEMGLRDWVRRRDAVTIRVEGDGKKVEIGFQQLRW
jgi:hypothetical protein